jgi:excisionase family DNA binding protein
VQVTLPAETIRALAAVLARYLPAPEPQDPSPFLTVAEAAVYLRASRQRVYDLLSSRRLPRHRDGARVLIRRADLDAYLGQPRPERDWPGSSYGRRDH